MRIHTISPSEGSAVKAKRLGRGIGSGLGKTSGKGHKGQWARSGGGVRPNFEGGTMPLSRRMPKRGFNNIFRAEYVVVNVSTLEQFEAGAEITLDILLDMGLVNEVKGARGLKVLGDGTLTKALNVKAHKFSQSAKTAIEAANGTCVQA